MLFEILYMLRRGFHHQTVIIINESLLNNFLIIIRQSNSSIRFLKFLLCTKFSNAIFAYNWQNYYARCRLFASGELVPPSLSNSEDDNIDEVVFQIVILKLYFKIFLVVFVKKYFKRYCFKIFFFYLSQALRIQSSPDGVRAAVSGGCKLQSPPVTRERSSRDQ